MEHETHCSAMYLMYLQPYSKSTLVFFTTINNNSVLWPQQKNHSRYRKRSHTAARGKLSLFTRYGIANPIQPSLSK